MNKKGLNTKKIKLNRDNISIYATVALFLLLFIIGSVKYRGFFSSQVIANLFIDNAYLIVVAIGEAVAILTGGIDLSVGAMIAFVSMITASLLEKGLNPFLVIGIVLVVGIIFGTVQGILIQKFGLHPWIVTLAGMFFARGASYLISIDTIIINDPTFSKISSFRIPILPGAFISINVVVSLIVLLVAVYMLKFTKFGRSVYALGGNEASAKLMGLSVEKTKVLVYTFSGYGLHCNGMEMDAIAACVIGGILLTGGYGNIIGPLFGVLTTGIIQTLIMFDGTLNSWWTKIAVGMLLFIFIVLQRVIVLQDEKRKSIAT